jgi:hypothetical protein
MQEHYSDKRKFFTKFVSKDRLRAVIQINSHRLHATIHVKVGERLVDDLNNSEKFLALTDVEIYAPNGELLYRRDFVALNRDHIEWIIPEGDTDEQAEGEGD